VKQALQMAKGNMMRIAIAGSGGLARIFAQYINETVHPFIILSRSVRFPQSLRPSLITFQTQPDLEALGYQVIVVNYDNQHDLRFNLRGIDLVISTISGNPQINLMDAAAHSEVTRFIPAEFEGPPARRPRNDPLDRGRAACLDRLRHWSHHHRHHMAYTVFSCGVFYERFARGGLISLGIGASTPVSYQGSYLLDIGLQTAEIVENNLAGQPISIVLTSVYDLARFLVAALELNPQSWPAEFRMQGDRRTVAEIVQWAEAVRGGQWSSSTK